MEFEEKKDVPVRVDRAQSNAGGPESHRFDKFNINCNLGNHRPQRLYYARDGTPYECLELGVSTGLLNVRPPQNPRAYDIQRTTKQTQLLQRRERDGERVSYSLVDHTFVSVSEIDGTDENSDWERMFPSGHYRVSPLPLTVDEFQVLESKDIKNRCFFGHLYSYGNLSDEFAPNIVRSVFSPRELLRMCNVMLNSGRLFFLLPAVTKHLAPRVDEFVLCEVDFENHNIVFYFQRPDSVETLRFYGECMWSQFVFPAQERQWKVLLFEISEDAPLLASFVFLIEARTDGKKVQAFDVNLPFDDANQRARNVLQTYF